MSRSMLDISSNNHHTGEAGELPWSVWKDAGYSAVMIKATEGIDYVNPFALSDAHDALACGLAVGYYHFAQPGLNQSKVEVNHLWQTAKDWPRSLGLAVDVEVTNGATMGTVSGWAKDFLQRIPTEVEQKVLYCDPDFLDRMPGAPWGHDLWLASWGRRPRRHVWAWQSGTEPLGLNHELVDVSTLFA